MTPMRNFVLLALLISALSVFSSLACATNYTIVTFPTAAWDKGRAPILMLRGVFYKPEGAGPFPAIVGLHGCYGLFDEKGKISDREAAWAHLFVDAGYAVLFPDSYSARSVTTNCGDGPSLRAVRITDSYGALLYLQSLPFINPDAIALMGWSQGGSTLLFSINEANRVDFTTEVPKGFRAAVALYPRCVGRTQPWSTTVPTLVLMGGLDTWAPAEACLSYLGGAVAKKDSLSIKVYPDAYHDFDFPDMKTTYYTSGSGSTHRTETNERDRADALVRVRTFLDKNLKEEK